MPYGFEPIPLSKFSGLSTLTDPTNLPVFMSPDCLNVEFLPGLVRTRPGTTSLFAVLGGNPTVNYLKTYITQTALIRALALDSLGIFYKENPFGTLAIAASIEQPGAFGNSVSLFTREYIAIGNGQIGSGIPRQFDDVNFDRVSQVGPGGAPSVVDSANTFAIVAAPTGATMPGTVNISTALSSNNLLIFVTTATPHGLINGQGVVIAGASNANLNGNFTPVTVSSPTTFSVPTGVHFTATSVVGTIQSSLATYTTATPVATVGTSVTVTAVGVGGYNVTKPVLIVTGATFGLDIFPTVGLAASGGGTVTFPGNIVAGVHQVSVMFVTRQGYITAPAPPVSWTAAGGQGVAVSNITIGPPNVVQRILIFTAAGGLNFFYSTGTTAFPLANMVINDNTTTSVEVDFTDAILLEGTSADSFFNLIELGECSGVTQYSSRLFWWGERNKLNNIVNPTFDGGFANPPPITANAGPNTPSLASAVGFGTAWASPGNVTTGATTTATLVNLGGGNVNSNELEATGYGFAIPLNATILGIKVVVSVKSSTASTISDNLVQLLSGGIGSINRANGIPWSTSFGNQTYGSTVDTWAFSLTPAQVNDPSFGFGITAKNNNAAGTTVASINGVSITVYYSTPASGLSQPLGWTQDPTFFAGGASALSLGLPIVWGDAYSITGNSVAIIRGLITQGMAVDYLNNPILAVNTQYSVRARIRGNRALTQGTFHINLYSASGGINTTGIQLSAGATTTSFVEYIASLGGPFSSIPSDLVIRVYVDGLPITGDTWIVDNIEVFPTNNPTNTTIVRASFVEDPESYDGVTGFFQAAENNGQPVRCCFVIRSNLYAVKDRSMYVTQDDGVNEPNVWTINEISQKVGTLSVRGVGVGDEWAIIAGLDGVYYFEGGPPQKISQEIQTTWDSINWALGYLIDVKVDTKKKRAYISVPLGATATANNTLIVLDFVEGFGDPALAAGVGRKWAPWPYVLDSMNLILRPDGTQQLWLGNGAGTGKIYQLDSTGTVFSDDGVAINSYWQSGYFQEQGRLVFGPVVANITGSGTASLIIRKGDQNWLTALRGWLLPANGFRNLERVFNIETERLAIRIGTNAVGANFSCQGIFMYAKQATYAELRGVNY